MTPELWLASYDISDSHVRYRVDRLLTAYGERLQKSVFSCRLTAAGLRNLRERIGELIDAETDSVRFYPLCVWCEATAARQGLALSPPVPMWWSV